MTGWIIVGSIIAFFVILFSFSLTIYVKITDEVNVAIGAFGYRKKLDFQEPSPEETEKKREKEERKKKKKTKKSVQKKESPKEQQKKKITFKTFGETIEFALTMIKSILKPTGTMLKHIRITGLTLQMTVCSEDADETAIHFGQICMGIYNLLGHLDNLLTLKVKKVNIRPDFISDEAQYDIHFKVKLRFSHILMAGLCMLTRFIGNTMKQKQAEETRQEESIGRHKL